MSPKHALLTRQRAWEDSWIVQQRYVNGIDIPAIATMAALAIVQLADGSYSLEGGLGKPMAQRTVYWRLSEVQADVVEHKRDRPMAEYVFGKEDQLERAAAIQWQMVMTETDPQVRLKALSEWRTTQQTLFTLLGANQPTKVQVEDSREQVGTEELEKRREAARLRAEAAQADLLR